MSNLLVILIVSLVGSILTVGYFLFKEILPINTENKKLKSELKDKN